MGHRVKTIPGWKICLILYINLWFKISLKQRFMINILVYSKVAIMAKELWKADLLIFDCKIHDQYTCINHGQGSEVLYNTDNYLCMTY